MIALTLAEAAKMLGAECSAPEVRFNGVSTDTRTLVPENLFVALSGPNFDGHDFLAKAQQAGASCALVSRETDNELPSLHVEDTRLALGVLAAAWRARFEIPLVAVTGSNGKTTVKEMIAAILNVTDEVATAPVLATQDNLNNDIGVPLTLFRLGNEHGSAVIEMGANHAGEIAYLSGLTRPQVALVNNAGPAHLEGFGSLEGVARAKGEIYSGLRADGVAVINADDPFAPLWRELAGTYRVWEFGLDKPADVYADCECDDRGSDLHVFTPLGECRLRLPLPGRHNVRNALAATACALAAGASLKQVCAGLGGLKGVSGRLQFKTARAGGGLIDDTYNANPASLGAALAVLSEARGSRWVVLGDMAELGERARELHAELAVDIRAAGVDRLFTLGPLSSACAEAFGEGAQAFNNKEELIEQLARQLTAQTTVLVKGSRSMGMEQVVEALEQAAETEGGD